MSEESLFILGGDFEGLSLDILRIFVKVIYDHQDFVAKKVDAREPFEVWLQGSVEEYLLLHPETEIVCMREVNYGFDGKKCDFYFENPEQGLFVELKVDAAYLSREALDDAVSSLGDLCNDRQVEGIVVYLGTHFLEETACPRKTLLLGYNKQGSPKAVDVFLMPIRVTQS